MGVGRSSQGQMNDDDLHRLRQDLFPDYPDGLNIKSLVKDPYPSQVFSDGTGFRVLIGGVNHAQSLPILEEKGITFIVNMAAKDCRTTPEFYGKNYTCLMLRADDTEEYDLSVHFGEVSEFIEEARDAKAGILVHCMAGVSRSVTVVIAYLMKCLRMSLVDAAKQVHKHRPQSYPNLTFIRCLVELERELKAKHDTNQFKHPPQV